MNEVSLALRSFSTADWPLLWRNLATIYVELHTHYVDALEDTRDELSTHETLLLQSIQAQLKHLTQN